MSASLFEILDPRPSAFWRVKKQNDVDLTLWPEEFYRKFFHDDLSEGIPEIVETFNQVVGRLRHEFEDSA
jgi:hypothetical protein